jgi:hypothetical protein
VPHDGERRELRPIDLPMVPFAVAGLIIWALAGLVLLAADAPGNWIRICVAGFLIGLPGLVTMIRHDANRRARR